MNRIADAFDNKRAFIAYIMAGDPSLEASARFILAAQEGGADMVEIGIPFSDPIAEGEVIQAASSRALDAGTRLDGIFEMVASLRGRVHIPLLFMTYLNPVFVFGYERFFAKCAEIGISGVIIPDLPFEEQGEVKVVACEHKIEIVTLVAPTSSKRIAAIASKAEGFIYLVSSLGVTGVRSKITSDLEVITSELRKHTSLPIAIGFGISTEEQAAYYAALGDGVIVGSAIVQIIEEHKANASDYVKDYVARMKGSLSTNCV